MAPVLTPCSAAGLGCGSTRQGATGQSSIGSRAITCPVLAIQGADDEYGLPAQLDAIVAGVAGPAERALVPDCAHDPHHQARADVLERMIRFVRSLSRG
jgi:pimeloyl-ACP methyl ester carboxylesterase